MTEKELRKLYQVACDGKGFEPNEGQFKVWKQTLMFWEEKDVAQALVWHFQESTTFPMPAEVKTLTERARRSRVSGGSLGWVVRYQCPTCGVTMTSLPKTPDRPPRTCRSTYGPIGSKITLPYGVVCGAIMEIVEDRREQMLRPDQTAPTAQ